MTLETVTSTSGEFSPKSANNAHDERSRLLGRRVVPRYSGGGRRGSSTATSIEEAAQNSLTTTDESSPGGDPERSWKGITCRQYIILAVLMVATMTSSFAVCLFPPFFPKIAEEKGCSATVYGFIIGTNCLTSFIVTPFIGKNVSKKIQCKILDFVP